MKTLLFSVAVIALCGCSTTPPLRPNALRVIPLQKLPPLGTTAKGETVAMGGFSGLQFEGIENGQWVFLSHPDRGPNAAPIKDKRRGRLRPFAVPDYQLEWVRFRFSPETLEVFMDKRIPLSHPSGKLTGRPFETVTGFKHEEKGTDLLGRSIAGSRLGADLEGITSDGNGSYWMADEYGPSILKLNKAGVLISRYVPEGVSRTDDPLAKAVLPKTYLLGKANRGFEAVAFQNGKVYAILQSPLKGKPEGEAKHLVIRILEFDPATEKVTGEFFYPLESKDAQKIGDATSVGNGKFLVIEQNSDMGPNAFRRIYEIDLTKATNLTHVTAEDTLERLPRSEWNRLGIEPAEKRLVADLVSLGFDYADKIEGLTLIDRQTIALLTDNDFGLQGEIKNGFLEWTGQPTYFAVLRLETPLN